MTDAIAIRVFWDAVMFHPRHRNMLAALRRPAIGYFCTTTPVEIIHAAGFVPLRISGGAGPVENAYNLAPDFMCPFMKRSLERALCGEYRHLAGIVQGYSCDAACGVTNIWAENIGGRIIHTLPLPYNDTPHARAYFRHVLMDLAETLNAAGGAYAEDRLAASIALYSRIRRRLLALMDMRQEGRWPLSTADFYAVVSAAALMPPEDYLSQLDGLIAPLGAMPGVPPSGVPVLISGSLVERIEVLAAIEELGGRIADDDLCSGRRSLLPATAPRDDPIEWVIDRHFSRPPCPSRSRAEDRIPWILERIDAGGAQGVIFLLQKCCTPHLADVPALSDTLSRSDIPSISIEMDESWPVDGQWRTRVEGFIEMMTGSFTDHGENG